MNLILAVYLLLSLASNDWQKATTEQSKEYINVILDDSKNADLHLWALSEIYTASCNAQDYIIGGLNGSIYYDLFYQYKCDKENILKNNDAQLKIILEYAQLRKSYALLAYYLTQSNSIDSSAVDKLLPSDWDLKEKELDLLYTLAKKNKIGNEVLEPEANPIIYLGILTSKDRNQYLTTDFLQNTLDVWKFSVTDPKKNGSLKNSILISAIISAAYILYDDRIILDHAPLFLNANNFPNSLSKLRRLNAIDFSNYIYGNFDKSLEIQRNYSLPLAEHLKLEEEKNSILTRHGAYLFTLGKFQDSKKIYEELQYRQELIVPASTVFNNLSINYLILGENNKYLEFQFQALENAQINKNSKHLLNIYRNLFVYYTSIKDINSALTYIEKAKEVAQEHSDNAELARIESFLGTFYWNTYKDHEKSLAHFELAEQALSADEHYESYRDLLLGKSEIYIKTNNLLSAKQTLDSLKELTLSKADTPAYLHTVILLSAYHLKMDQLGKAESDINEITMHSLDVLSFELLTKFLTIRSEYLYRTGDTREALFVLTPVIDQIINRTKNSTDTQSGFWTVEDEYLDAFHLMVQLYQSDDNLSEALVLLDQLKTINDAYLYNNPLIKANKLTENQLADEKRLNDHIQSLRKKYLNSKDDERFKVKMEIDRLSAEREEILNMANLNKELSMPPIWSIQRSLGAKELVLHFTELGTHLYVTYLTADEIAIKNYGLDKGKIEKLTQVADQLAAGNSNLNDLYSIFEALELENLPDGIEQVTVIPDNYLYRIPLEILPTSQPASPISYGSARYLIEDYHFRYFTSLQEFSQNRRSKKSEAPVDFSVFAISDFNDFTFTDLPSLPFAVSEASGILSELNLFDNKNKYTENNATKQQFIEAATTSRMVHVATHSEISEQNPLFSTIYLKGINNSGLESDQALYAYELFETNINSDFIMLNSCSSGSGNYMQGTGIMGISRALRYAGAKSLALNLWSVNDKVASEFATEFYANINAGYSKSEAIRKAKLDQLNTNNANPHFWGAYMAIGNPAPLIDKYENSHLLYSGILIFALSIGYMTRRVI